MSLHALVQLTDCHPTHSRYTHQPQMLEPEPYCEALASQKTASTVHLRHSLVDGARAVLWPLPCSRKSISSFWTSARTFWTCQPSSGLKAISEVSRQQQSS